MQELQKKLGFPTKLISISNFSHEESSIEYYKKYSHDKGKIILKELAEEMEVLGVSIEERNLPLEELLKFLSKDSVPIVLINWKVIEGKEGFNGHFLPITGYDNKNVYVHNPGIKMAQPYLEIEKSLFIKAWEDKGTDKDTIIIYRKP